MVDVQCTGRTLSTYYSPCRSISYEVSSQSCGGPGAVSRTPAWTGPGDTVTLRDVCTALGRARTVLYQRMGREVLCTVLYMVLYVVGAAGTAGQRRTRVSSQMGHGCPGPRQDARGPAPKSRARIPVARRFGSQWAAGDEPRSMVRRRNGGTEDSACVSYYSDCIVRSPVRDARRASI